MSVSIQFDLIPGVVARVFAHDLAVPCWTYVTQGLVAFGQKEIAFTLARPPGVELQKAPPDPLHLLRAVAELAQDGRLVDEGGITEIGPTGLFGVPALRGVTYQTAWPMAGVTLPPGALAAVALVAHEMDIVKRFGALRVLARLGRANRFFPTAPWCIPNRAPAMPPETGSILDGVASARFDGVTVVLEGASVVLRVPRATQPAIGDALRTLAPDAGVALHASIDASADACLVWSPGQSGPEAISAPGSQGRRLSGCFALFVPQQSEEFANPFEDGFAMMLRDATWARVRHALASGAPISVPPAQPSGKTFAIEFFEPPPLRGPGVPAVSEMRMVLRETQADIDARASMAALVDYANAIERTVQEHFAGSSGPGAVLELEVVLATGRAPALRATCWPELAAVAPLQTRLAAIAGPQLRLGEIAFRGTFALWGGAQGRG